MLKLVEFYRPISSLDHLGILEDNMTSKSVDWLTYGGFCISLNLGEEKFMDTSYEMWLKMRRDGFQPKKVDTTGADGFILDKKVTKQSKKVNFFSKLFHW